MMGTHQKAILPEQRWPGWAGGSTLCHVFLLVHSPLLLPPCSTGDLTQGLVYAFEASPLPPSCIGC
jgi:hypothetical protein